MTEQNINPTQMKYPFKTKQHSKSALFNLVIVDNDSIDTHNSSKEQSISNMFFNEKLRKVLSRSSIKLTEDNSIKCVPKRVHFRGREVLSKNTQGLPEITRRVNRSFKVSSENSFRKINIPKPIELNIQIKHNTKLLNTLINENISKPTKARYEVKSRRNCIPLYFNRMPLQKLHRLKSLLDINKGDYIAMIKPVFVKNRVFT